MFFRQKIFLNNKPLILTTSPERYMMKHPGSASFLYLKDASPRNFRLAQKHLEQSISQGAVISDDSMERLEAGRNKVFVPVAAAGGLVFNQEGSVLMILRNNRWDLPKGKVEPAEGLEEGAKREVKEETGLDVTIDGKITDTFHAYPIEGRYFLKTSHWFKMRGDKNEVLIPQKEEGILEVRWVPQKELENYLSMSYETIKEVVEEGLK